MQAGEGEGGSGFTLTPGRGRPTVRSSLKAGVLACDDDDHEKERALFSLHSKEDHAPNVNRV